MEPDFFKMVTNRPDKKAGKKCPFCRSKKLREEGTTSTLVGGGQRANHVWVDTSCDDCGASFIVESKGGNTWVTGENGKILEGVPSCFESYIYTCSACLGEVTRTNVSTETGEVTGGIWKTIDGKMTKLFKTIFKCASCEQEMESEQEYYSPKQ